MTSQVDLDQGGTSRQWVRTYLGPSVGWINVPAQNIFPITATGTYIIDPSVSLITLNVAAAVTVILPSCVVPVVGAQAQPGLFAKNPITIVDVGGNCQSFAATIQAKSGETIMGFASIQLATNYGGYTLQPNSPLATWNNISP